MSAARLRLALVVLSVATIAACSAGESTGPKQLKPVPSLHDDGDSVPDVLCKSGYMGMNGKCTGE